MSRASALLLVDKARDEAERLKGKGELRWTSASPDCPTEMWLAALGEELGEVCRAVHDGTEGQLLEELAHLAGVAVGRIEALLADHADEA